MTANVGIIGRARSGKDTAGAWLVDNRGYVRVSFADPIREAALRLNPVVGAFPDETTGAPVFVRLAEVVGQVGWETAKSDPEVRRILQEYGMTIRAIDPDFWLRTALAKVKDANDAGKPVVITDVRFPNERDSLERAGFHLLFIDRPGVAHLDHESEGALSAEEAEHLIINNGTVDDLHREVWLLADRVERMERTTAHKHFALSY